MTQAMFSINDSKTNVNVFAWQSAVGSRNPFVFFKIQGCFRKAEFGSTATVHISSCSCNLKVVVVEFRAPCFQQRFCNKKLLNQCRMIVHFQNPLQMALEETVTIPHSLLLLKHTLPHLAPSNNGQCRQSCSQHSSHFFCYVIYRSVKSDCRF